jgi:hypothetical protein
MIVHPKATPKTIPRIAGMMQRKPPMPQHSAAMAMPLLAPGTRW